MPKTKTKENNYSPTMVSDKLEVLYELQNVDSQIDKVRVLRGELPLEVTDLESEIKKLNDRLDKQSDIEAELNNSIVQHQNKIEEANVLIKKYETQQMKVRNNREFDAINKEMEFQGLEIELANKKIKGIGVDIEENADKIKLIKAKIRERKKHLKNKKAELDSIIQSTEKEEVKLRNKILGLWSHLILSLH